MAWEARVIPVSIGLETTGYAHQVVNGNREITVTHHTHRNYDHIHSEPSQLGYPYEKQSGIGRREPDLTPHPEAIAVANALNALEATTG
jgi:hypothetical protein